MPESVFELSAPFTDGRKIARWCNRGQSGNSRGMLTTGRPTAVRPPAASTGHNRRAAATTCNLLYDYFIATRDRVSASLTKVC